MEVLPGVAWRLAGKVREINDRLLMAERSLLSSDRFTVLYFFVPFRSNFKSDFSQFSNLTCEDLSGRRKS